MTGNVPTNKKTSGTEAATAREAVLSWAETQSRIRVRATRAREYSSGASELLPMSASGHSAALAMEVVGVASDESRSIEHPGGLEAFAVECALDAAWATEFWRPTDPDYGVTDYFEAAAARHIGLLRGFEELGDSATRRGIFPGVEGEQVQLVTGGGGDWGPEPANLRDSEQAGLQAFSIGGGENGN